MNVLEGPARTYPLNNYAHGMAYGQAAPRPSHERNQPPEVVDLMKREYDSDSRQLQIQSTLECLNLDAFMSVRSLTTHSDGLTKLVEHHELLTPQCPPGFRSDENKIRFLRKAFLSCEWALAPIRNIVSHRYKFHSFVTALHESLELTNELKDVHSPAYPTRIAEMDEEQAADVFFQRYGRNTRDVRNRMSNRPPGRPDRPPFPLTTRTPPERNEVRHGCTFDEARRRKECFKCALPWLPGHRCHAGAIAASARSRLRKGEYHVHIIRDYILRMEGEQEPREGSAPSGTEGDNAAAKELEEALYYARDISDYAPY